MKIKSLIIALLITLMTSVVFAQNATNNNTSSNAVEYVEVNFYPDDDICVENNENIKIKLGASHGWESISIKDSSKQYISIYKNDDYYIYAKDTTDGCYKWQKISSDNHKKIKAYLESINFKSKVNFNTEDLKNRIFDKLTITVLNDPFEAIGADCFSERSYVPYCNEVNDGLDENGKPKTRGTIYSIVIDNNKISYIISGTLNKKSKLYSIPYSSISEIKENTLEWIELNNIYAFSLKELQDKRPRIKLDSDNNDKENYVSIPVLGKIENYNKFFQKYFQILYDNQYPVFGSKYISKTPNNSFDGYKEISEDEGNLIAKAALRYLNWAVEYKLGDSIYNEKIYDGVNNKWGVNSDYRNKELNYWPESESSFPQNINGKGNPVPYVKNGVDTPRTFWKKMSISKRIISNGKFTVNNGKITSYKNFQPGIGSNLFKYAGTDSLGLFTGCIAMSNLDSKIQGINNNKSAKNLNEYSKSVGTIITKNIDKEKYNENQIAFLNDNYSISNVRFTWEDIEFISIVIPDFTEIRKGDILIDINNNAGRISIVTNVIDNKSIDIVYINETTYGTAELATIDFKNDYENFTARRLIVYDKPENKKLNDVLSSIPSKEQSTIIIGSKAEQTQEHKNLNWKFIPNTGEYLLLDNVEISLKNSTGVNLLKLFNSDDYIAKLIAKDREYISGNKDGNIYNNRAEYFEVGLMDTNNDIKQKYKIKKNETEEEILLGQISKKEKYYTYDKNDKNIYISDSGNLIYKENSISTGTNLKIGIRPESSDKAYPGDDLIIGLEIKHIDDLQNDKVKFSRVWSTDKDYIAVYDKKMMWRANLYINKTNEAGLNGIDWNDEHPWNAPAMVEPDANIWFGKNVWNHFYKSDTPWINSVTNFSSLLENLPAGDGKQVVSMQSTSWYYGLGGQNYITTTNEDQSLLRNYIETYNKTIEYAVAYDFWGWDNPFSYKRKLQEALLLKGLSKDENGPTKYKDFKFSSNYRKKNSQGTIIAVAPYKSSKFDYPKFFNDNEEKNVIIDIVENDTITLSDGKIVHPYVPGITDAISYNKGVGTSSNDAKTPVHPGKEIEIIAMGTDCNGLVQSSVSYSKDSYKALNSNVITPIMWGNSNTNAPVMSRFVNKDSSTADYKDFEGDNVTAYKILKKDDTQELKDNKSVILQNDQGEPIEKYQRFKFLVPGDIIIYYYTNGKPAHIMIVSSIEEGKTKYNNIDVGLYWDDATAVKIIESVYNSTNQVFGVVKSRTLDRLSKNDNSWEVWRLIK